MIAENPQNQAEIRIDTRFKPGQSGNPGGKPVGMRNKLQADFLKVLSEDFAEHGIEAVIEMREKKPAEYIKAIASLMPKELEISRPLDEINDDELTAAITAVRAVIAAQAARAGAEDEEKHE